MYKRKTQDEYEIQQDNGYGFEVVTVEETWKAAKEQAKCYRENEPHAVRIVKKRVPLTIDVAHRSENPVAVATAIKTPKQEAIAKLQALLAPGDTIYGIVRHVSPSGMSRVIDFCIIRDNRPLWLRHNMSVLLKLKRHQRYDGLFVPGCGMDMIFSCVYDLGRVLSPNGFTPPAGYSRNGEHQTHEPDGGYAFRAERL